MLIQQWRIILLRFKKYSFYSKNKCISKLYCKTPWCRSVFPINLFILNPILNFNRNSNKICCFHFQNHFNLILRLPRMKTFIALLDWKINNWIMDWNWLLKLIINCNCSQVNWTINKTKQKMSGIFFKVSFMHGNHLFI